MIGTVIGGHIRVLEALGQGGMGEVYVGRDERLGRRVAVKAVRSDRERSDEARERFLREARTLSSLDHPNICRLYEYIQAPEGDFLVLELIEGVTLTRAVERGVNRARKLRIAEQILAALIAAHRKGIVHRDLKPDNVMITPDGTVKVLDFGIARLEEGPADEPHPNRHEELVDAPVDGDAPTLIYAIAGVRDATPARGVIVGTPLYMSPEQAAGSDVSTASDLYSFGLLLQMMLTEEPPHDPALDREQLLRAAARGESLPLTGQPRDLTALVAALKQRVPAQRPTAQEALASLERIVGAPKRRLRIAIAATIVVLLLAGAVRYALDVTAARDEARRGRQRAQQLIAFMVGDLRQNLEAVGRLDALDGVASRALAYFASLRAEELSGEELDQNARALAQLGDVRDQQGKLPEAIELFRQSVRFASAAVQRDPSREEWELTLSNAYFELGDAYRRQGNSAETLRNFQSYFEVARRLAQRHPDDLRYQAEVSYGHGNLGAAYEAAGDGARALQEFQTACTLDRERLRREPANEQWQADLANSVNRLGVMLKSRGDLAGARGAFLEDLQFRRRLAAAAPTDVRRQERLATSLAYIGTLQQSMGDDAQALAAYREEVSLTAALLRRDPSNAASRRNHSVARFRMASLLPPNEGLPLVEASVADLRSLVAADARAVWRRDLAAALLRLASIHARLDHGAAARRAVTEARSASEVLVVERRRDPHSTRILCEALLLEASLDERQGRAALANERRLRAAATATAAMQDPAVAAARVQALVALGREREALPLVRTLLAGGYGESEFRRAVHRR